MSIGGPNSVVYSDVLHAHRVACHALEARVAALLVDPRDVLLKLEAQLIGQQLEVANPELGGRGVVHTFNAQAAAEPYTEDEAKEALAKGVGRVTAESLAKGRPPRNWWEIPRENSRSKERQYGMHPSMKPLKICERLVQVHSARGEVVVIPFGGSGSECVAAPPSLQTTRTGHRREDHVELQSMRPGL